MWGGWWKGILVHLRSLSFKWLMKIMARLEGRLKLGSSEMKCMGEQLGDFLLFEV